EVAATYRGAFVSGQPLRLLLLLDLLPLCHFFVGERRTSLKLRGTLERHSRLVAPHTLQIRIAPRRFRLRPASGGGLLRGKGHGDGDGHGGHHHGARKKAPLGHVGTPICSSDRWRDRSRPDGRTSAPPRTRRTCTRAAACRARRGD